jgi:hypothetical protein
MPSDVATARTTHRLLEPTDTLRPHVAGFEAAYPVERIVNAIPDAQALQWMASNVPLLDCPDDAIAEAYYFRWWVYRKHIKQTPAGRVVTEFLAPVIHAGQHNAISCALGHHIAEGRWLRDDAFLEEYVRFWHHGGADGGRARKFHNYSSWLAAAVLDRAKVRGSMAFAVAELDELIADYRHWESERLLPGGLFWQYDVRDGMEESISGSRTHRNARPTINSYMLANARAIATIAHHAGRADVARDYAARADRLRVLIHEHLWDAAAGFFKAQTRGETLADVREAIGFIPWAFDIPDERCSIAWKQLVDPHGFWAPAGLTTAERRHPLFRSHGVGQCEWDGAVWPFATSQTLDALAVQLRHRPASADVTKQTYLDALRTYAASHRMNGKPYVGEYHDEITGHWLKGDNPRSEHYNHSTFADLVIAGLIGLVPRLDDTLELHPLLPADAWDWFCLDGVRYQGRDVTITWDRDGSRYGRERGLAIHVDGTLAARSDTLGPLHADLRSLPPLHRTTP